MPIAVTIHESHAVALEHSILFAHVRPEEDRSPGVKTWSVGLQEAYDRTSYNAPNVAVSRAQLGSKRLHLFSCPASSVQWN
jgi:hypothetical protein